MYITICGQSVRTSDLVCPKKYNRRTVHAESLTYSRSATNGSRGRDDLCECCTAAYVSYLYHCSSALVRVTELVGCTPRKKTRCCPFRSNISDQYFSYTYRCGARMCAPIYIIICCCYFVHPSSWIRNEKLYSSRNSNGRSRV